MKAAYFFLFCLVGCQAITAQTHLRLVDAVEMAQNRSIAAKQALTTKETRYWEYKTFQSNYKPQLVLDGSLPDYQSTFREVTQPNGTSLFPRIRNNRSSARLSLEQNIARTGATVYAASQLLRFDDFILNKTLYNSNPVAAFGIEQPLLRFNQLRWDQKIEPLKYKESRQEFIEDVAQIAIDAGQYYFELLLAQVNLKIAQTNLKSTADIWKIANEKYALGKTSRNELLQLELEQLKAQKGVASARRDVAVATLQLKSFVGIQDETELALEEPYPQNLPSVDADKLLDEAFANRADAIAFSRRKLEADRAIAKAKGDNGVNATLIANVGLANSSAQLSEVTRSPQRYQTIELQLSVPIVDWGRSKSRIKTAQANAELTGYAIQQAQQTFKQEIFTEVTLFDMLKEQLALTEKADRIAGEQYQIASERYVLGNLDITDLSLAFAEKDRAKRDHIAALRDYWLAYYRLRKLTLYDFEKNEKIN